MIFNSFNFIVFFPLIFILYYLIPVRFHQVRNVFLLVVSYLLYINFNPVYSLILLGVTTFSYITAIAIDRYAENRKVVLLLGGALSLLPLLLFKYYNFVSITTYNILSLVGLRFQIYGLNWTIPIGISFYTLQAIGYVLDVYYKRINSEKGFIDYALFISFFPSILSGPINKASLLLPQLKQKRVYFDYAKSVEGFKMILWGLFMKVVVADRSGIYVDTICKNYSIYSSSTCFVSSILYSIQIYCDFAGYSLMAIGVGKTLGFELTENFRRPYFSSSVNGFWKRWHISLSTWLKDNVYIPLGGNRCGTINTFKNLLITFLISGIWHGASWTFVLWGVTHALWMIAERLINQNKSSDSHLIMSIKIVITFLFVNFAWILFKMQNFDDTILFISNYWCPIKN